jgi:signal transduction histidine kinase
MTQKRSPPGSHAAGEFRGRHSGRPDGGRPDACTPGVAVAAPDGTPLALGVVVAASLIAAETLLVYLLKQVAPHSVFGVLYLIGVLVVSTGWGFGLATATSVASALAFNYFRVQPGQGIIPTEAEDAVAIVIFLVVALLANTLAYLVRSRAAEADQRRRESDLAAGSTAARIRNWGIRSGVGAPVVVEGQLWGVAMVGWSRSEPLPPDTEARVANFADLVATAIANAETRAELTASRARIVAAADDARRHFERDLHDGAQQRLVFLGLKLRTAVALVPPDLLQLNEQISDVVVGLAGVSEELREISRGIHPAILSKGGLCPAVKALGRRSAVPVQLDLAVERRLPETAEVAAYYVVAEALTNVVKHAQASEVSVCVAVEGANLRLSIRDDGVGGADSGKGSGLLGLIDRVEALGGTMKITSSTGTGTSLLATIPLEFQ